MSAIMVIPSEVIKREIVSFQKWRKSKENLCKSNNHDGIQAREVGLYVAILKARGELGEWEKLVLEFENKKQRSRFLEEIGCDWK